MSGPTPIIVSNLHANASQLKRRTSNLSISSSIGPESTWLNTSTLAVTTNPGVDIEKRPVTSAPDGAIDAKSPQDTYLYLGFGSNLARSTFEGRRKVRPLAQVNVHVPAYELTFDLPGIAYVEPCFANSRRRTSGKSSQGDEIVVALDYEDGVRTAENLGWSKGLVGTAYEVSASDFKHIIETEGAGATYIDTVVEAWILPEGTCTVPDPDSYPPPSEAPVEKIPDLSKPDAKSKPLLVHTLVAPLPSTKSHTYRRPNWAQPSARYLGLIRTGAYERGLPDEYITWLHSLSSFRITNWRQTVGKYVFLAMLLPAFLLLTSFAKFFVDDKGQAPTWLSRLFRLFSEVAWWSYDVIFQRIAGEGERTIGQ